jgi:hypothetical protein
MNASIKWKLTVCLLGGLWSVGLYGQVIAEKPDLRVGDRWVFRQTGTEMGKSVDRRFSREVIDIAADGMIRIKNGDGTIRTFDSSWNPRNPQRPEFWPQDFQFPLRVGAEWSFASPPATYYQNGGHRVSAYESITVPAGTFDCFRIEGKSIFSTKSRSETWIMTRWYCPAVKNNAKSHVKVIIGDAYGLGSWRELDSELIRFTAGE